jgi:hypothetical protein
MNGRMWQPGADPSAVASYLAKLFAETLPTCGPRKVEGRWRLTLSYAWVWKPEGANMDSFMMFDKLCGDAIAVFDGALGVVEAF